MCAPDVTISTKGKNSNPIKSVSRKKMPILTRDEVKRISDPNSNLLLIIEDKVYDVTNWQYKHPGGHLTLRALCGKDATESYYAMHSAKLARTFLKSQPVIGTVEPKMKDADAMTGAFRDLTKAMLESGMYETKYSFYYILVARIFAMFAGVLYLVLCRDEFEAHCAAGMLLGLVWQQAAFIGHDLGHNGISHNRLIDSYLGLFFGNLFTGFSIGWWKRSHNVHHIVTNSIEHDPDIQHLPFFAVNEHFLHSKVFSTWFNHVLPLSNVAHVLVKYQHYLYYPIMAFARFNLYVQSLLHAIQVGVYNTKEYHWNGPLQLWTLVGFHVWMFALTMQIPTVFGRLMFYLLAQNVAGILHIQITLSHFSMPTYNGVTYDDVDNGYVRTQLKTSLDIDCPYWMDWFHGGLQFQVVHHLWPRIPRHNLRLAQDILISFCKEHDLTYHRMGFFKANISVISQLKETSMSTKSFSDIFSDSLNLVG
mmetsp:Transcript_9678/g.12564  ORF Transcript_9678/g.12564 Transcript_9678/m.12564 type:complete len:478 (+) Transcript_9678:150-1583(+)